MEKPRKGDAVQAFFRNGKTRRYTIQAVGVGANQHRVLLVDHKTKKQRVVFDYELIAQNLLSNHQWNWRQP